MGWRGGRISRDLRGLFQPAVPSGFVWQVHCVNYKPELNIIGGRFFQWAPSRDNLTYDFTGSFQTAQRGPNSSIGLCWLLGQVAWLNRLKADLPQRTKVLLLVALEG